VSSIGWDGLHAPVPAVHAVCSKAAAVAVGTHSVSAVAAGVRSERTSPASRSTTPGSSSVVSPGAEAVPASPLLSSAMVEVPFSRDIGCYTPPTSPTSAATPAPAPPVVPCAPPPRRSSRHTVADDGSFATDEDTMQKAMRRKAAI
jgi:hypothetical protein